MSELNQTGNTPTGVPPKNYLVESILVTLFCCLPFGVAGIVFATQVNSKFSVGDTQGAIEASKNAKKWMMYGVYAGVAVIALYILFIIAFGGMAALAS